MDDSSEAHHPVLYADDRLRQHLCCPDLDQSVDE